MTSGWTASLLFVLLRLGSVLLQTLPVAIPANELRTHTDTAWIVAAAAKALPRGSILAVGGVMSNSNDAGTRSFYSGDRGPLDVVARSLALPLDTSTIASKPPPCASDTTYPEPHGYRIERVSIARDNHNLPAGRPDWFHYVVSFTRTCRREFGHQYYIGSDVRFDAMPDAVLSYKWVVGTVEQAADPPRDPEPSFREKHGTGFAFQILFYGSMAFPLFGLLVGVLSGDRGLLGLLGVWSLVGLALAIWIGVGGILGGLVVSVLPAVAFVAGARRAQPPPALGRATLVFVIAYPICFMLAWVVMLYGAP